MTFLSGLSAFSITPTDNASWVGVAALRRLVDRLVAAKVDSIDLRGSTGIYMYPGRDERRWAIEAALDEASGHIPIITEIAALCTDDSVKPPNPMKRQVPATLAHLSAKIAQ